MLPSSRSHSRSPCHGPFQQLSLLFKGQKPETGHTLVGSEQSWDSSNRAEWGDVKTGLGQSVPSVENRPHQGQVEVARKGQRRRGRWLCFGGEQAALAARALSPTLWVKCPRHMHTPLWCLDDSHGEGVGWQGSPRGRGNSRPEIQGAMTGSLGNKYISQHHMATDPPSGPGSPNLCRLGCIRRSLSVLPTSGELFPENEGPEWQPRSIGSSLCLLWRLCLLLPLCQALSREWRQRGSPAAGTKARWLPGEGVGGWYREA